ncbi:MAG: lysophospholipid acyltransferase family protein [Bacteroidota bacterium]
MTIHKFYSEGLVRMLVVNFSRFMFRPKLIGQPSMPEGPCFFYGNHANDMDPFILNAFTPFGDGTAGVMTMEQFRSPLRGHLMRSMDLVGTRKHLPEPNLIRFIMQMIKDDRRFCIYPEGGRRWDGRPIDDWIDSTAKVFVKMGVPVYPVATRGSYVGWPRWAAYPRPARIELEVLDPIQFERKTPMDEALALLKSKIDFDENVVPERIRPKRAYKPAQGIDKLLYRDPDTGENGGLFTTDGTAVQNRTGTLRYTMQPDSRLLDAHGELHTTAALYDRVRALDLIPDNDGAYITNTVDVFEEIDFPNLEPKGTAQAQFFADHLIVRGDQIDVAIALEDIRYASVEKNYKWQLYLSDRMLQVQFTHGGSVLQWDDTLKRVLARA